MSEREGDSRYSWKVTLRRRTLPIGDREVSPVWVAFSDSVAWVIAILTATLLRFELDLDLIPVSAVWILVAIVVPVGLVAGWLTHLYRRRFVTGSVDELRALIIAVTGVVVIVGASVLVWGPGFRVPRSLVFLAAPIFVLAAGAMRLVVRKFRSDLIAPREHRLRALVYGSGKATEALMPQLLQEAESPYMVVGMIDDSPTKSNRWIRGIPTLGSWSDLKALTVDYRLEVLIVAIPTASSELLARVDRDCKDLGLQVVVLPAVHEYLQGRQSVSDLRRLKIEDFLGRDTVGLDLDSSRDFIFDKRVLVTGAGGSIGSELVMQVARLSPAKVLLVDQDETALVMLQSRLQREFPEISFQVVVCNIRESDSVDELFRESRPEVVLHAAALKHLPVLERHPDEAWKTNVLGTMNVLQACTQLNVKTLVNISTDKAADPANVLGRSKKLAEEMTTWAASETKHLYVSVRFGNVLGSRGSLIPVLTEQIEAGGPVSLTDGNATRFFMSISEASRLVIQALAVGKPGEVLVLDMGEPVRIKDIAERMIEMSGRKISIEYSGLRDGEKVHERLVARNEEVQRSAHPRIMKVKGKARSFEEVLGTRW